MSAKITSGAPRRGMILRGENLISIVVFFAVCKLIKSPDLMPEILTIIADYCSSDHNE